MKLSQAILDIQLKLADQPRTPPFNSPTFVGRQLLFKAADVMETASQREALSYRMELVDIAVLAIQSIAEYDYVMAHPKPQPQHGRSKQPIQPESNIPARL